MPVPPWDRLGEWASKSPRSGAWALAELGVLRFHPQANRV